MPKGGDSRARRLILMLLALFFGLGLATGLGAQEAGWKEKWDKAVAGAKKEGRLVLFAPAGQLLRDSIIQGFKKAYPDINLEYHGGRDGELTTKILAERTAGIYTVDVLMTGSLVAHAHLRPNKALDPIEPALILPEVTNVKNWRDQQLHFSDKEGKYNLVYAGYTRPLLALNPKVKQEEVDEYQKLLDPKWKGRINISDPVVPGGGYAFFHWLWTVLGSEKTADYARRLRAQAGLVDRNNRRQLEWVAQGRYDIVVAPGTSQLHQLLNAGLQIGVLAEFKGLPKWLSSGAGSVMLMNKSPRPNAASVFINWMLSREGQTAWSRANDLPSRRIDVPTDHIPAYMIPKPGVKYWQDYLEGNNVRSEEEEKLIKEVFGQ
jgi:iron(III) transport system substrate-binding protein